MQWPLLGYRHNYNTFRNNQLVLTNIASNLRFILDKNAFVMIIIPVENKLIQFDSPCNLLNVLLPAMFIFICFLAVLSVPALFYLFFFCMCDWVPACDWFLCADPDQLSDPALMMVASWSMWQRCVCFALRFTPLCISSFFFTFLRACWDRTALTWNQKLMIG